MKRSALVLVLATLLSCGLRKAPENLPPGTLLIEFSNSVRYVLDLEVDGKPVPIEYTGRNKFLLVEGLKPGSHHFNLHSISYVFGPEFERFEIKDGETAHFFINMRRYRLSLPKKKAQVSIRAYRKELRKQEKESPPAPGSIRARFL